MKQILDSIGFATTVGFFSANILNKLHVASDFIVGLLTNSLMAQVIFNLSAGITLIYVILKAYNMFINVRRNYRDSKMKGIFKINKRR